MPDVVTRIRAEDRNVTYEVYAYRTLDKIELVEAVRAFHAQKKVRRRKPVTNATVKIVTLIGATGRR
jgi:hypothetical protein